MIVRPTQSPMPGAVLVPENEREHAFIATLLRMRTYGGTVTAKGHGHNEVSCDVTAFTAEVGTLAEGGL